MAITKTIEQLEADPLPVLTKVVFPNIRERILSMGVMGSGKSYQWLKMAETLLPAGIRFKVLDTDEAIPFMLATQFPHLIPENGGNVFVRQIYDWPTYKDGRKWAKEGMRPIDWIVVDMIDDAWRTSQNYFISSVFEEDMGEYFLHARQAVLAKGGVSPKGKKIESVFQEGLDGWMDWPVINRLYDDWISPLIHSVPNLYVTSKFQKIGDRDTPDTKLAFGHLGIRPSGQKQLGHQVHICFLLTSIMTVDGTPKWLITTAKDRANRAYFAKTPLHSMYKQYLVAKARWPLVEVPSEG